MALMKVLPPDSVSVQDLTSCPAHVLDKIQARFIAGKVDGHVEVAGLHRSILDFSENIMFTSREESTEWKQSHPGYVIVGIQKLDDFHHRYVITERVRKDQDGVWKIAGSALLPVE